MDRARQRCKSNLDRLTAFNPALKVLGDRQWVDECENGFITYMAKKIWMYELTDDEVKQVNKAVTGYIKLRTMRSESTPVRPGNRVVKGTVINVKNQCREHETCGRHWYANVRTEEKNTIYTLLPPENYREDLVGQQVEFFACVTVSSRDKTFGFAHAVKLFKEKSNAR